MWKWCFAKETFFWVKGTEKCCKIFALKFLFFVCIRNDQECPWTMGLNKGFKKTKRPRKSRAKLRRFMLIDGRTGTKCKANGTFNYPWSLFWPSRSAGFYGLTTLYVFIVRGYKELWEMKTKILLEIVNTELDKSMNFLQGLIQDRNQSKKASRVPPWIKNLSKSLFFYRSSTKNIIKNYNNKKSRERNEKNSKGSQHQHPFLYWRGCTQRELGKQ